MTATESERLQFMQDMQAALSQTPKRISPKYFYDQAGSALFDRICELPEYYPTRTELSILQTHAEDISNHMGENADIIEFGAICRSFLWWLTTPTNGICHLLCLVQASELHFSQVQPSAIFHPLKRILSSKTVLSTCVAAPCCLVST